MTVGADEAELTCAVCTTVLAPGSRFCSQCGTPLRTADPDEGSVRVVTALFSDMVSSVEHTSTADPEAATELVEQVVNAMATAVLDHGGEIDRLLGDGLFALFGARHAAEDAPERAVRAGLQICDAVDQLGLHATVGITTGSAYLGPVGSETYAERTAMGSTVNLAARLRAAAKPGEVLVGRLTRKATLGRVHYEARTVDVKGIGPTEAFRALRLQTGPRRRGFEGRTTQTVGRAPEQTALADALDQLRHHRGGAVFVIGEPGLGKTRLVEEVAERARALGVRAIHARCDETASASYSLWIDALRQHAASLDDEPANLEIRYLTGGNNDQDAAILSALSPTALRGRLLNTLERHWLGLADVAPTLLVLEDLHWADPLSLAVLERLLPHIADHPLLIVATQRPDHDLPCDDLPQQAARVTPDHTRILRLNELEPEAASRLLALLLGRDDATDVGQALALERAQGNPLFVEELVSAAVDAQLLQRSPEGWTLSTTADAPVALDVPDTLQTIVLSRVDRLAPEDQRILRTAAVLGRTFFLDELARMVDDEPDLSTRLDEIEARGLVFCDDTRAEPTYAFKHALVHETISSSILRRHREPLHRAAARAIEHCRGTDGAPDRLADHWDATTDDAAAFTALTRAAAAAHRTFQLDTALDLLDRASTRASRLDLDAYALADLDERRGDLLELAGRHEAARASYLAAAEHLGPGARFAAARLQRKQAHCWTIEHDYERAAAAYRESAQALDAIAERNDDWWHERLQGVVDEARMNYWRSDTDRMAELDEEFDADINAHGSPRQLTDHLTARMLRGIRTSRYAIDDSHLELADRVARMAANDPDLAHRSFMVFNFAFCLLWRRDLDPARAQLNAALQLAQRAGDVVTQSRVHTYLAVQARFALDDERCRDHTNRALEVARAGGMVEYEGAGLGNQAWLARRAGDPDDAERLARAAIACWRRLDLVYGFSWTARLPLLAVHTLRGEHALAAEQAVEMNQPSQQRLLPPMESLLDHAQVGTPAALADLVRAAEPLGYC